MHSIQSTCYIVRSFSFIIYFYVYCQLIIHNQVAIVFSLVRFVNVHSLNIWIGLNMIKVSTSWFHCNDVVGFFVTFYILINNNALMNRIIRANNYVKNYLVSCISLVNRWHLFYFCRQMMDLMNVHWGTILLLSNGHNLLKTI